MHSPVIVLHYRVLLRKIKVYLLLGANIRQLWSSRCGTTLHALHHNHLLINFDHIQRRYSIGPGLIIHNLLLLYCSISCPVSILNNRLLQYLISKLTYARHSSHWASLRAIGLGLWLWLLHLVADLHKVCLHHLNLLKLLLDLKLHQVRVHLLHWRRYHLESSWSWILRLRMNGHW